MLATLADHWLRPDTPDTAAAPAPRPVRAPLLLGDILMSRGGEPELLIRWRQDRAAQPGD